MTFFKALWRDEAGATAIEYGLIDRAAPLDLVIGKFCAGNARPVLSFLHARFGFHCSGGCDPARTSLYEIALNGGLAVPYGKPRGKRRRKAS